MVLVNRIQIQDLSMEAPDNLYQDILEKDLRLLAVSSAVSKMEENERLFYSEHFVDEYQTSLGLNAPAAAQRHSVTPKYSETPTQQTLPRHCSTYIDDNVTQSITNSSVPFNPKNSAITRSFPSPRQLTLSSLHRKESGLIHDVLESALGGLKSNDLSTISSKSFDYDENEDIPLEHMKFYKTPRARVVETEDIYRKACSNQGVTASQTFVKQVTTSRSISMANSSLSYLMVKPIAISLVKDQRIRTLDVSGNTIGPLGVTYLAEMIAVNDTIQELNLSNTHPGRLGMQALARSIPCNKSLLILRLESNFLDHTETEFIVHIIREAKHIAELYLGHNNLGYEGAKILSKELETNVSLVTLDLQWNHFRKQSATQLCNAIKVNKGLKRLNLSWNGLGKEGCIALAKALPRNRCLRELDLTNNRIDVVALPFLLHGLVRNNTLEYLHLARNPMTTEGAKAVVRAVTKATNMSLKYLNIEDIPVDKDFTELRLKLQESRNIHVNHGVEMYSAIEMTIKEHDPHDLNRFDPVMVLVEYMRIDNLRLIDLFQFFDTSSRGLVSKSDLREGVSTLGLPLTEHHLDCIMKDIDKKKDGYIDLEEFMIAQRDMSKVIVQRTTKAKGKGKEDLGLKELRQIIKGLVEKRNVRNKEKASIRAKSAAQARALSAANKQGTVGKTMTAGRDKVITKKATLTVTKPKMATVNGKKK